MQSLNKSKRRTSHPAEPNACSTPIDTKENAKALQKQTGNKSQAMEKETANAEIRKGKVVIPSRPAIDTAPKAAPRIIGAKETPAVEYAKMPQISPPHQQNARNKRSFLRCR